MLSYQELLGSAVSFGDPRVDRTGVGTRALFGEQLKFDLRRGFPMVTTRAIAWRTVVAEVLWYLSGCTTIKMLQDAGVHIWDKWADEYGSVGPIYGKQWRAWECYNGRTKQHHGNIDQIANLVEILRCDPYSRRQIVSAWNVADLPAMAIPPCPLLFQTFVSTDGHMDLQVYQRSADIFLGLPHDIAGHALIMKMLAQVTGHIPRFLYFKIGDAHLYENHVEQALIQLKREPRPMPSVMLSPGCTEIDSFAYGDCVMMNYDHHPALTAPVAV